MRDLLCGNVANQIRQHNLHGAAKDETIVQRFETAYLAICQKLYQRYELTQAHCVGPCQHHTKDQWQDLQQDLKLVREALGDFLCGENLSLGQRAVALGRNRMAAVLAEREACAKYLDGCQEKTLATDIRNGKHI
jgi:hypothetical protein